MKVLTAAQMPAPPPAHRVTPQVRSAPQAPDVDRRPIDLGIPALWESRANVRRSTT